MPAVRAVGRRRYGSSRQQPHSEESFPLDQSTFFREMLAEREEILLLKWLVSEKAGYDVGIDRAVLLWTHLHRASWKRERQSGTTLAGR